MSNLLCQSVAVTRYTNSDGSSVHTNRMLMAAGDTVILWHHLLSQLEQYIEMDEELLERVDLEVEWSIFPWHRIRRVQISFFHHNSFRH